MWFKKTAVHSQKNQCLWYGQQSLQSTNECDPKRHNSSQPTCRYDPCGQNNSQPTCQRYSFRHIISLSTMSLWFKETQKFTANMCAWFIVITVNGQNVRVIHIDTKAHIANKSTWFRKTQQLTANKSMFIVMRRYTIYTPPKRQASSDFEGLHVCIL